jgi:hypothetical protein
LPSKHSSADCTPIVRMLSPLLGERFIGFPLNLISQALDRSIIHFGQTVTPSNATLGSCDGRSKINQVAQS